jgi:predicted RNA binding protein YcfA (HicA-like mRNA interferase family)
MPSATALDFQRVARRLGFVRRRQTGSHERWNHPDGRAVTIPLHGGREIGPPLFYKILRQLVISLEEFERLRRAEPRAWSVDNISPLRHRPPLVARPRDIIVHTRTLAAPGARCHSYKRGRVYGRLDCPAARRAIARGGYVKNRVFFASESTAIAAGYRPCAVCIPESCARWKRRKGPR